MLHLEGTAVLRQFSSSNNNSEWEFDEKLQLRLVLSCDSLFFANGNCEENKGYVSIIFCHIVERARYEILKDKEFRCYVSVLDVAGNKRFTQSDACVYDSINRHDLKKGFFYFGLERYLKRETLLNDPDELLPGDCLTVCIDFDYIYPFSKLTEYLSNIELPVCLDEDDGMCISLDTFLGRKLCRESEVFRFASEIPMKERRTRKVPLPKKEMLLFVNYIFQIFVGSEKLEVTSIQDVSLLYRVADKYDIQSVIEACRQLIKAFLCTTDNTCVRKHLDIKLPEILELADAFRDDDLKNAVVTYLESKEKFGKNYNILAVHMKKKLYPEWKCEYMEFYFKMSRIIKEPEFEFYQ